MSLKIRVYKFLICVLVMFPFCFETAKAQMVFQPTNPRYGGWGVSLGYPCGQDSLLIIGTIKFDFDHGSLQNFALSMPNTTEWIERGTLDSAAYSIQYIPSVFNGISTSDSFVILPVVRWDYQIPNSFQTGILDVYKFSLYDTERQSTDRFTAQSNNIYSVSSTVSSKGYTLATGLVVDTALWNRYSGNRSDNSLICIDSLGHIVWSRYFGGNGYDQPHSIIPYKDGGCLISSVSDVDTTSGVLFQGLIYRMDSNGIQTGVFTPRPPRPGFNMRIEVLGVTPDSGYILLYDEDSFGEDGPFYQFIVMINSDFEEVWTKEVLIEWRNMFVYNGYIIYGGNVNKDGSALLSGSYLYDNYGWVGKLNQAGNYDWRLTLWQHPGLDSGDLGRRCIINDCIEKPDGGWWCTGSARDTSGIPKAFLLSIDSSGCVDQFCPEILSSTEYFAPAVTRVNVYPNPAHQQLNIEWESDAGASTANWDLRNVMGQVVLQRELSAGTTSMQLPDLPSGLYHWTLRSKTSALGSGRLVVE